MEQEEESDSFPIFKKCIGVTIEALEQTQWSPKQKIMWCIDRLLARWLWPFTRTYRWSVSRISDQPEHWGKIADELLERLNSLKDGRKRC